ncbi:MAG: hypothetical protein PW792_16500 [Acidobacteriaceae bacterium]|nr:hypothetical protein [Acidobacteriaceae bacterium]
MLYSFTGAAISGTQLIDGANPTTRLLQTSDGTLYSTTSAGGLSKGGTLFKINPDGTGYTQLHSFNGTTLPGTTLVDGLSPTATDIVQASNGAILGTTLTGGASGYGIIYNYSPATATYTVQHSFGGSTQPVLYSYANGLVEGSDGGFYGSASTTTTNIDSYYRLSPDATTLSTIYANTSSTGPVEVFGSLLLASDGNLYGASSAGGSNGLGLVERLGQDGSGFSVLHQFTGGALSGTTQTDGASAVGGLLQGSDGNFYGTTYAGGSTGGGTIYNLTPTPALAAPIVIAPPASIVAGFLFPLTFTVSNAYSATMESCFASVTSSTGVYTLLDAVVGSPTSSTIPLTAPATPGTYTLSLTCGGTESNSTTLTVQ